MPPAGGKGGDARAEQKETSNATTQSDQDNGSPPDLSQEQLSQRERKLQILDQIKETDDIHTIQNNLRASISKLESQITQTESQLAEAGSKLKDKDAAKTVQRHIRLLHSYNEIKDVGQGLMGLIADARGVRHVDVQREFGVGGAD